MKTTNYIIGLLIIIVFTTSPAYTQSGFAYTEKTDTVFSGTLNEKRPLYIYLPEGYDKENIRYPVIYILDGETRCTHGVPTVRFISSEGLMPKAIVVGIPNVNRNRDFLPGRRHNPSVSDSADNFMQFLSKDLFSYVETNYKASSYRVLIGHSFGGLFAMHAMLTQPEAFEAYIIIDPSFWYGSKMMVKKAGEFFANRTSLPKTVYISGNEGTAWHGMANDAMDSLLKVAAPKDLRWKTFAYADENHGSVTFKTIYDGLRFVFNDYRNNIGLLAPNKGMLIKDKPYDVRLYSSLKTLYYTLDGSRPTRNSLQVHPDSTQMATFTVDKNCTLTISAGSLFEGAAVITGKYDFDEPLEPVKNTGKLKNGLQFRAFKGSWDKLPDFSQLTPYSTGIIKNFNLPDTAKDFFGMQYEGYIFAEAEGYYDMVLNSDDGSRLFVNGLLIVDNDGLHGSDDYQVYRLYLKKGYHEIKVDYFEKNGGEVLRLDFLKYPWTGNPDMKIQDELLFH